MKSIKNIAVILIILGANFMLSTEVNAACTDSYSKTSNSISISWDVADCKKLHKEGDFYEICWKENTTNGLVCSQNKKQFNTVSGNHIISGLKSNKGYTFKTSYQRKIRWDVIHNQNMTTEAETSTSSVVPPSAPSSYITHSSLDNAGCRVITWGGVRAVNIANHRVLVVQRSGFGMYSIVDRLSVDVTQVPMNGKGAYVYKHCDLSSRGKYRLHISEGDYANKYGQAITPFVVLKK